MEIANKKIINEIIKTYSFSKKEFAQCIYSKDSLRFKNDIVKGYEITIKKEIQYGEPTGRLQVDHTDYHGKIQYTDIWTIENNLAMFVCRDTFETKKRKSDYDYVKDIEAENREIKNKYKELLTKYNDLLNSESGNCNKYIEKRRVGRPTVDNQIEQAILQDCKLGITKSDIAKKYNVERKTIYNILNRNRNKNKEIT